MSEKHFNLSGIRANRMRKLFRDNPQKTSSELAKMIGASVKTIRSWRRALGLVEPCDRPALALRGEPRTDREEAYWNRRIKAGMKKFRSNHEPTPEPPVELTRYHSSLIGGSIVFEMKGGGG